MTIVTFVCDAIGRQRAITLSVCVRCSCLPSWLSHEFHTVRETRMPACRFELAKASRVWRQGVPTALIMDQSLHMLQDADAVQVSVSQAIYLLAWGPEYFCEYQLAISQHVFCPGEKNIAVGVSLHT